MTAVTVVSCFVQMYSHVDADGGTVDCERYSVLNILLNLCKAVKKNEIQRMLWAERTFLGWEIDNVKQNSLSCIKEKNPS